MDIILSSPGQHGRTVGTPPLRPGPAPLAWPRSSGMALPPSSHLGLPHYAHSTPAMNANGLAVGVMAFLLWGAVQSPHSLWAAGLSGGPSPAPGANLDPAEVGGAQLWDPGPLPPFHFPGCPVSRPHVWNPSKNKVLCPLSQGDTCRDGSPQNSLPNAPTTAQAFVQGKLPQHPSIGILCTEAVMWKLKMMDGA